MWKAYLLYLCNTIAIREGIDTYNTSLKIRTPNVFLFIELRIKIKILPMSFELSVFSKRTAFRLRRFFIDFWDGSEIIKTGALLSIIVVRKKIQNTDISV